MSYVLESAGGELELLVVVVEVEENVMYSTEIQYTGVWCR